MFTFYDPLSTRLWLHLVANLVGVAVALFLGLKVIDHGALCGRKIGEDILHLCHFAWAVFASYLGE